MEDSLDKILEVFSKYRNNIESKDWEAIQKESKVIKNNIDFLTESEALYENLIEKINIGVALSNEQGEFLHFNDAFASIFGYSIEEMKKQSVQTLVHPDDIDKVMKYHAECINDKKISIRHEFKGIKKDGSTCYFELDTVPVEKEENITGALCYTRNITERKETEKAKLEAEVYKRMSEALGGIAHDLNNPLTVIMGNSQLMLMNMKEDNPNYKRMKKILDSTERMSELIQNMREIKGIKTKEYVNGSKILDFQKSVEYAKPDEKSILVVDDKSGILEFLADVLSSKGYNVDTAGTGEQAVEMAKKRNYAVVFQDMMLPGINGLETFERMKEYYTNNKTQIPAVIMMTGYDVEDIMQKCKDEGAFTALHKPIDMQTIIKTAENAYKFAMNEKKE